jgi:hypothetical protein
MRRASCKLYQTCCCASFACVYARLEIQTRADRNPQMCTVGDELTSLEAMFSHAPSISFQLRVNKDGLKFLYTKLVVITLAIIASVRVQHYGLGRAYFRVH